MVSASGTKTGGIYRGREMKKIVEEKIREKIHDYQSPFFIYSFETIKEKIQLLKQVFQNRFEVFCSMKANSCPALLKQLKTQDVNIEVCSKGELEEALHAGFTSERIIFLGPGKSQRELEYAIRSNVSCIVVESKQEIKKIEEVVKMKVDEKKPIRIIIRINPAIMNQGAKLQMTGGATQFGIQMDDMEEAIEIVRSSEYLQLYGFHVYYGSMITDADVLLGNFKMIFQVVSKLVSDYHLDISFIDFGGGFGETALEEDQPLDWNKVQEGIQELILEYESCFPRTMRFAIESGRFLMLHSGYYVCKVLRTSVKDGKGFAVLDGGIHHISTLTGFGSWARKNYPFELIQENECNETAVYDIWGPNSTKSDLLGKNLELPLLDKDTFVVFINTGAYMKNVSPSYFSGREVAKEYVIE